MDETVNTLIATIRAIANEPDEKTQTEAALKLRDIIRPRGPIDTPRATPKPDLELIEASITVAKRKLFSKLLSNEGFDDNDIDCILACLKKAEI
jgi:hypothetical protein